MNHASKSIFQIMNTNNKAEIDDKSDTSETQVISNTIITEVLDVDEINQSVRVNMIAHDIAI